jgi:hypothetical protein
MSRLRLSLFRSGVLTLLVGACMFTSLAILPGTSSALPAKSVVCTGLSGNTAATVTVSGCHNGGRSATGGLGTLAFGSPTGGTVQVKWANGATMVISLSMLPYSTCDHSFSFKVKVNGSASSETYVAGVPGVGGRIKALVCAVPAGSGYSLSLYGGDFQF